MHLSVVFFPHPEGPRNTTNSPFSIWRFASFTATVLPNRLVMFTSLIMFTAHYPLMMPKVTPLRSCFLMMKVKMRTGRM